VLAKKLFEGNPELMNRIRDYGFDSMDVNIRALDIPTARFFGRRAREIGLHPMGGGSLPADKELLSEPTRQTPATACGMLTASARTTGGILFDTAIPR
jgi:hypothetical protein